MHRNLSAEQAQRLLSSFKMALHHAENSPHPYATAWSYLSGCLESMCHPHLGANAFPSSIPPQPTQETTQ